MIDLSDKTMATLLNSMLLRVTEQVNKRDGSLIRTALSAAAWVAEGLYIELSGVQNQAYATSATGSYLDLKVAERGLTRHPATYEVCNMLCNLSNLTIGRQFADASGYTWNVSSAVLDGPTNGLYTYHITCQTAGAIPEPEGDLRSLEFLAGLSEAKFGGIYVAGQDQETDTSLHKRYEESLIEIAFAGNVSAYREKVLELEYPIDGSTSTATVGALQVYAITDADGNEAGGNVKIWIVDSEMNVASEALVSAVQKAICPMYNGVALSTGYGIAPIGASVHIATATSTPVLRIEIQIEYNGTALEEAKRNIAYNILLYIQSCIEAWGTQVTTPESTASITIREALIISASLVSGVTDVLSVVLKKDGVASTGTSISWNTTRSTMEWIVLEDIEIVITT